MKKNSDVHVVYKNLGETPAEAVLRFKKEKPEFDFLPVTYAGRLDPMAEGLLLLLSGEEVKNKEKFLDLPKTYEAEILWGFHTDTLDILGIVSDEHNNFPEEEDIKKYLSKTKGLFEQTYPLYSSRPVLGKSLFQWAREGKENEIQIPKHGVEVFQSSFLGRRNIFGDKLLNEIISKISLVNGDFRQKVIMEKWREVLKGKEKEVFVIDKISLKVSSGFYVRQFVYDMSLEFGLSGLTFHIKRTEVGEHRI
jgi:tRNA pseudouridine(55) synthase